MNYHIGQWNKILTEEDTQALWKELHRIVAKHPLVRQHKKLENVIESGKYNDFSDMAQELYTHLLSNDRFNHYLESNMSDVEIEREISVLEVTNLMTLKLRKRFPESFRMSRRIYRLLNNDARFTNLDDNKKIRSTEKRYGLAKWEVTLDSITAEELEYAKSTIDHVSRDTRRVGASGDAQIIISNDDLATIIVALLEKLGHPLKLKQVREIVMSKLPLMDINITPIDDIILNNNEDDPVEFQVADIKISPEQEYINKDFNSKINYLVDEFLEQLKKQVKYKKKQHKIIINVLWLCYLSMPNLNQLSAAKLIGVSDALVHYYRKLIETSLKDVKVTSISEGREFELALKAKINDYLND